MENLKLEENSSCLIFIYEILVFCHKSTKHPRSAERIKIGQLREKTSSEGLTAIYFKIVLSLSFHHPSLVASSTVLRCRGFESVTCILWRLAYWHTPTTSGIKPFTAKALTSGRWELRHRSRATLEFTSARCQQSRKSARHTDSTLSVGRPRGKNLHFLVYISLNFVSKYKALIARS